RLRRLLLNLPVKLVNTRIQFLPSILKFSGGLIRDLRDAFVGFAARAGVVDLFLLASFTCSTGAEGGTYSFINNSSALRSGILACNHSACAAGGFAADFAGGGCTTLASSPRSLVLGPKEGDIPF